MSIYGLGTDIAPVDRFAKIASEDEGLFVSRMFSDSEARELRQIRDTGLRHRAFAASFAVKESVFKALGTGLGKGMSWRDVEVSDIFGNCSLTTYGRTQECFKENKITRWSVTCSASDTLSIASVILFTED